MNLNWEDYKAEFTPDGQSRKIVIKGVNLNDWQSFIDFMKRTEAGMNFYCDGEAATLPENIWDIVLDQKHACQLSIRLNGITAHCYFLLADEIELEIDPVEIDGEAKAKVVFRLMSTVGRTLNKHVVLTLENNGEKPAFRYEPGSGIKYLARH
jgi:hypothetical protein